MGDTKTAPNMNARRLESREKQLLLTSQDNLSGSLGGLFDLSGFKNQLGENGWTAKFGSSTLDLKGLNFSWQQTQEKAKPNKDTLKSKKSHSPSKKKKSIGTLSTIQTTARSTKRRNSKKSPKTGKEMA